MTITACHTSTFLGAWTFAAGQTPLLATCCVAKPDSVNGCTLTNA